MILNYYFGSHVSENTSVLNLNVINSIQLKLMLDY